MKGTAQFSPAAPLFLLDPPSPYTVRHLGRIAAAFVSLCSLLWLLVVAILWTAQPILVFRTDLSREFTRAFDPKVSHETAFPTRGGLSLHAVVLRRIAAPKLMLETGGDHHSVGFDGEGRLNLQDAMRRFWAPR